MIAPFENRVTKAMAAKHTNEVQTPADLATRLQYAGNIVRVFADYIQQKGKIEGHSLAFAERAIVLYHDIQVASNSLQSLQRQLLDLSWSLVTRMRSDPTDRHHALRERLAKERFHPPLHDGTHGELLYFTLKYVHLAQKVRQSSIAGDNWPEDVDELAKHLLSVLQQHDPHSDAKILVWDAFCVFGEGALRFVQVGNGLGIDPEPIEELSSGRVAWLGADEPDAIEGGASSNDSHS